MAFNRNVGDWRMKEPFNANPQPFQLVKDIMKTEVGNRGSVTRGKNKGPRRVAPMGYRKNRHFFQRDGFPLPARPGRAQGYGSTPSSLQETGASRPFVQSPAFRRRMTDGMSRWFVGTPLILKRSSSCEEDRTSASSRSIRFFRTRWTGWTG